MVDLILTMPDQLAKGLALTSSVNLSPIHPSRVLVVGMGGSAISGDLVAACLNRRVGGPQVVTVREQDLPPWAGKGDLVVAVSYSGNTEETLNCFRQGLQMGCDLAGVASGGALEALCRQHRLPFIKLPPGLPPRAALGYLFSSLVGVLDRLGPGTLVEEVRALEGFLRRLASGGGARSLAEDVARYLHGAIPIIYGPPQYAAVARRWQTQLNENSKVLAWHGVIPEMDHNEIVGWVGDTRREEFAVVLLEDPSEGDAMARRIQATLDLIGSGVRIRRLEAEGENLMNRMFHLVLVGDLTSAYLAGLRGVDPFPVKVIEELKAKLGR
jgi:glucose/mannose-6-phosphate isomerase